MDESKGLRCGLDIDVSEKKRKESVMELLFLFF